MTQRTLAAKRARKNLHRKELKQHARRVGIYLYAQERLFGALQGAIVGLPVEEAEKMIPPLFKLATKDTDVSTLIGARFLYVTVTDGKISQFHGLHYTGRN